MGDPAGQGQEGTLAKRKWWQSQGPMPGAGPGRCGASSRETLTMPTEAAL